MICADLQISPENSSYNENRTSKTVPKPPSLCTSVPERKHEVVQSYMTGSNEWYIPLLTHEVEGENDEPKFPWFTDEVLDTISSMKGAACFGLETGIKRKNKDGYVPSWDIPVEKVFELVKSACVPVVRWGTELRRYGDKRDKNGNVVEEKGWKPLTYQGKELRYCMVLDFDAVGLDVPLEEVSKFSEELGANGYIIRPKGDCYSFSIPFYFDRFVTKDAVHSMVDALSVIFETKFGMEIDLVGSKGYQAKNIFVVEKISQAVEKGLLMDVGHRTWYNWSQPRRDWKKHESWWFDFSEDGTIPLVGSWSQKAVVFHRHTVVLDDLFQKIKDILSSSSSSPFSCVSNVTTSKTSTGTTLTVVLSQSLSSSSSCVSNVTPKGAQKIGDAQKSRQAYALTRGWSEVKKLVKGNGDFTLHKGQETILREIYSRKEKESPEYQRTGKTMASEGDNWIERQIQCLMRKGPGYWKNQIKTADYATTLRSALSVVKMVKWSHEAKIGDERIQKVWSFLKEDKFHGYLKTCLKNAGTPCRMTLYRWKKVLMDFDTFKNKVNDVISDLDPLDSRHKVLSKVLSDILSLSSLSLSSSSSSCVSNVTTLQERVKKLKTQTEEDNEPPTKWTAENEKWLHVEKVDNFDHLNTDMENRMMGREYIRDAERYHTEGLYGLRDEAVHAARSYGYIGGFSWESKQDSLDWAGIHSKVFKTEETPKESKAQKTTVSFADIRARLNRMKGASNA